MVVCEDLRKPGIKGQGWGYGVVEEHLEGRRDLNRAVVHEDYHNETKHGLNAFENENLVF